MKRYAIIKGARTRREVEAYLPENYRVIHEYESDELKAFPLAFVIQGKDVAGWTLDKYVIPRFGSGSMGVEEIDLSHPVMKEVPAFQPEWMVELKAFGHHIVEKVQAINAETATAIVKHRYGFFEDVGRAVDVEEQIRKAQEESTQADRDEVYVGLGEIDGGGE